MKGEKGDTGPVGPTGPAGKDGTSVKILGGFDSEDQLPDMGNLGDGYLINGDL